MKQPPEGTEERIAGMTFASVYPLYLSKVEKKGRTEQELHTVIEWLTGFSPDRLRKLIQEDIDLRAFFARCNLNPNAHLITGAICGYKVEALENPFIQKARYLDKIVDELAKGRPLDKIMRDGG
ncbi:MAG: DUF2200 domain-containing protein [Pseudomonadota bacterium]